MKIRIIAAGKIKEKWTKDGIDEYIKRLGRYTKVEIVEVEDSPDSIPVEKALENEAKLMLSKVGAQDFLWVMDLHGKELSSEQLSKHLISDLEAGGSNLSIIIGGSNGLHESITARANRKICLGQITLTHQMTRLILLEQIYRGFKIANNEKYHK